MKWPAPQRTRRARPATFFIGLPFFIQPSVRQATRPLYHVFMALFIYVFSATGPSRRDMPRHASSLAAGRVPHDGAEGGQSESVVRPREMRSPCPRHWLGLAALTESSHRAISGVGERPVAPHADCDGRARRVRGERARRWLERVGGGGGVPGGGGGRELRGSGEGDS